MHQQQAQHDPAPSPQIWAVGGGKGGVGKSVLSILFAITLAEQGRQTVVIDADLGGANLHTFMGIRAPGKTLHDFISRRCDTLDDVCVSTELQGLKIICGANEMLSLANLQYARKAKMLQALSKISAEHVILDLGAGTGFNTLDFFLAAQRQIVILTPQPVAIQNAYAFVRNAVYRTLSRATQRRPILSELVNTAMDPKNSMQVRSIDLLLERVAEEVDPVEAAELATLLKPIHPFLITNMAKEPRDQNAGQVIRMVVQKHLMVDAQDGGGVYFDPHVNGLVSNMEPLTRLDRSSNAFQAARTIVSRLENGGPRI